jgi:hypothetical protein
VAALLLGVGSIVGAWAFSILIGLILFAIVWGIIRDVLALSRLRTHHHRSACVSPTDRAGLSPPDIDPTST